MSDLVHRFSDSRPSREAGGFDSPQLSGYARAMAGGEPYIQLTLDVDQPIELGDFVRSFTSLGAEYERFNREQGYDDHATLFVEQIEQGSVIATLVNAYQAVAPWADAAGRITVMEDFVRRYGGRLMTYLRPGGRLADVTKAELSDFTAQVAAISHNPGSNLQIAAVEIKNGKHEVRAAFKFDTAQAREIETRVGDHQRAIDAALGDLHQRVLMVFTRSDIETTPLGKRSGERVRIDEINPRRSVPIIYASEMAERAIKYEIREAEDNVFKKGFVVDVTLVQRQDRLVAYRIMNLHQVIDLPDDDDD